MSRVFPDLDETDPEQPELGFPAGRRTSEGERSRGTAEPARAEFFRAQRRPVLPLLGLLGAVATVVTFLWLGQEDAPAPAGAPDGAPAGSELAPVAAAPDFELPFPDAGPGPAPAPGSLAAAPQDPLPGAPSVPSVLDEPAPPGGIAPAAPPAPAPAPESTTAAAPSPVAAAAARPARAEGARPAYAVQLLAARSEADVGASWERLRGAHPDLLASLTPSVGRASRGAGDTFYRLRAGPLPDRGSADALCKALSARQQPCFVVSPGS